MQSGGREGGGLLLKNIENSDFVFEPSEMNNSTFYAFVRLLLTMCVTFCLTCAV